MRTMRAAYSLTFHPAADLTNPVGHEFHGREGVEAFYRMMFSEYDAKKGIPSLKAARVQGGEISVRFLRPDVACVELRQHDDGIHRP